MRPNEHKQSWYKVPSEILFMSNKEISPGAKLLFVYILGLSYQKGYCYASNKHLSDKLGFSDRSINRFLSTLVNNDLIKIDIQRNNKNRKIYPILHSSK